jgi:hypothetical protein
MQRIPTDLVERILWALPPVLIAWMLSFGPFVLVLAMLHD